MVLQDSEEVRLSAYQVLFAHNPEGVLVSAPDGRITAANPAACALLGLSAEEICHRGRDGIFDQEDPRWRLAIAERDRTGSSVGVARVRRGDGRCIEIETTARLFHDGGRRRPDLAPPARHQPTGGQRARDGGAQRPAARAVAR